MLHRKILGLFLPFPAIVSRSGFPIDFVNAWPFLQKFEPVHESGTLRTLSIVPTPIQFSCLPHVLEDGRSIYMQPSREAL